MVSIGSLFLRTQLPRPHVVAKQELGVDSNNYTIGCLAPSMA